MRAAQILPTRRNHEAWFAFRGADKLAADRDG
jgi:hypothetical protein